MLSEKLRELMPAVSAWSSLRALQPSPSLRLLLKRVRCSERALLQQPRYRTLLERLRRRSWQMDRCRIVRQAAGTWYTQQAGPGRLG